MLNGNCTEAFSIQANATISGSSAKLIKKGIAPLPFPTGIELSACDLKHDFFHSSLKMIRTVERKFASGNFPVGPDTDRRSHEEPLELFDHLFNRTLAVQKGQQLILQRVESHRVVALLAMF